MFFKKNQKYVTIAGGEWVKNNTLKHKCRLNKCGYCKKDYTEEHTCYIEPNTKKDSNIFPHVYYDFECTQHELCEETGVNIHKPNYCIAMSTCSECTEVPCTNCNIVHTFSGLDGEDC